MRAVNKLRTVTGTVNGELKATLTTPTSNCIQPTRHEERYMKPELRSTWSSPSIAAGRGSQPMDTINITG